MGVALYLEKVRRFQLERVMNQALMMKVGWNLCMNSEKLWVKVIRTKYKCGDDIVPNIDDRLFGTNLWRGIVKNQENLIDAKFNLEVGQWQNNSLLGRHLGPLVWQTQSIQE